MSIETLETPNQTHPPIFDAHDAPALGIEPLVSEIPVTLEAIGEVVKQFSPRSEVDDSGLTRTVFERDGVTFAFMGREETPLYPTVIASKPVFLGRESVWLGAKPNKPKLEEDIKTYFREGAGWSEEQIKAKEDKEVKNWQTEHDRLTSFGSTLALLQEKNKDKPEHLLVEQSAYGLFAILARLQPENLHWKVQQDAVKANHYDEETLLLIDMVTALDAGRVDHSGIDAQQHPPLGEAVVIAALLGDEHAWQLATSTVTGQEEKEAAKLAERKEKYEGFIESSESYKEVEPFKPEDLVVVHTTRFRPRVGQEGYEVQTTHDALGYPRATVHTAINHKVESHLFGSWDDADYVVIAGFDKMLAVDGSPASINGADTWWTRNPGETLIFPDATLIAPGGNQTELFVLEPNGEIIYKTKGFTTADVETADSMLGEGVSESIRRALYDEKNQPISLNSEQGQRIIANMLRDALVRREITINRGKKLLPQNDDKFMSEATEQRLNKMAAQLHLAITGGLHNGGSDELDIEQTAAAGDRIAGLSLSDPKLRRTAYASGMMGAGGTLRRRLKEITEFSDDIG